MGEQFDKSIADRFGELIFNEAALSDKVVRLIYQSDISKLQTMFDEEYKNHIVHYGEDSEYSEGFFAGVSAIISTLRIPYFSIAKDELNQGF